MSVLCAISGEPPVDPVASKRTGVVYDRRLVEKHLQDGAAKCPVTGDDLSTEDLLPLRSSHIPRPRPASAQSIPGLLAAFQNEWDAVMLETCQLRKQLETTRQELSHVLYQHDAACRVIARVSRERDAARAALAAQHGAPPPAPADAPAEAAGPGQLPAKLLDAMTEHSQRLTAMRKKRKVSERLAPAEHVQRYVEELSVAPHSTATPGVTCGAARDAGLLATGGADGAVVLFDRASRQIVQTLTGHAKPVRGVAFHPSRPVLLSCGDDSCARVWLREDDGGEGYKLACPPLREHTKAVRGVAFSAAGDHFATASLDCTWNFYNLELGRQVLSARAPNSQLKGGYTCIRFHPDGLLLGMGTRDGAEKACCVWDLKQATVAAKMDHGSAVNSISFSENGFHMAAAGEDGAVKLWDLRRLQCFKTLAFDDSDPARPTPANSVAFDHSGQFLAVATSSVKVYSVKRDEVADVTTFRDHDPRHPVTEVCWGKDASWLMSTGMDRQVKCYAPPAGGGDASMNPAQ